MLIMCLSEETEGGREKEGRIIGEEERGERGRRRRKERGKKGRRGRGDVAEGVEMEGPGGGGPRRWRAQEVEGPGGEGEGLHSPSGLTSWSSRESAPF
jgi:hypothetical protein